MGNNISSLRIKMVGIARKSYTKRRKKLNDNLNIPNINLYKTEKKQDKFYWMRYIKGALKIRKIVVNYSISFTNKSFVDRYHERTHVDVNQCSYLRIGSTQEDCFAIQ